VSAIFWLVLAAGWATRARAVEPFTPTSQPGVEVKRWQLPNGVKIEAGRNHQGPDDTIRWRKSTGLNGKKTQVTSRRRDGTVVFSAVDKTWKANGTVFEHHSAKTPGHSFWTRGARGVNGGYNVTSAVDGGKPSTTTKIAPRK
jgi:hypothetical protein